MEKLLVCKVGGCDYYGNEYEYKAARLNAGRRRTGTAERAERCDVAILGDSRRTDRGFLIYGLPLACAGGG